MVDAVEDDVAKAAPKKWGPENPEYWQPRAATSDEQALVERLNKLFSSAAKGNAAGAKGASVSGSESSPLSAREQEIIALIAEGDNNKQIAEKLFISEAGVKHHLHNIFDKLGVSSRGQLIIRNRQPQDISKETSETKIINEDTAKEVVQSFSPGPLSVLSARKLEVATCVIREGLKNKEIADRLFISEQTVKNYLHRIFGKLGVSDREELIHQYGPFLNEPGGLAESASAESGVGEEAQASSFRSLSVLSARELEIVTYVAREGLSNKQIAEKLFISEETVKNHLHNIFDKLGISSRAQLIVRYAAKIAEIEEPALDENGVEESVQPFSLTPLSILSTRKQEIVGYVGQGLSNKEIAGKLFISEETVKNHLHDIFGKLGITSREELAIKYCGALIGLSDDMYAVAELAKSDSDPDVAADEMGMDVARLDCAAYEICKKLGFKGRGFEALKSFFSLAECGWFYPA